MRRWAWAALAGILSGCGQGNVGGGGIEIPNGLSVTVQASGGVALPGVKVRLLARDSWTARTLAGLSVVLDSAVTDAAGNATFRFPSSEGCWVEAVSGGLGRRIQVDTPSAISLTLAPLSTLSGNLGSGPVSGVAIRLGGSDRSTRTDVSGAFRFDSLPQGTWNLVAQPGRAMAALRTVDLGSTPVSVQDLDDDTSIVVLDDFRDGTDIWNLHGLFGGGYWWISSSGDPTRVFGVDGAWNSVTGDAQGHWISFHPDVTGVSNPWAGVGLDFGLATAMLPELSGMRAVRIACRGMGTWTFALMEQMDASTTRNWTADFALDTTWTTVRISAASLTNAGLVWSAGRRRVRQMMFQTNGSGKLEIREVALEGTSLTDWSE